MQDLFALYFCRFLLLKSADVFDVQKLNYFATRGFSRTLQICKILLEFYSEFSQFYDATFFYRKFILDEHSDYNGTRTHKHLVHKRTLNHLAILESRCSHLNFRFPARFVQGVPWHSGNYKVDSLWNSYVTW